jgi:peptidoglycan-associated lipoprotein
VGNENLGANSTGIPAAPRPGDENSEIDRAALALQTVYFDFDSSVLKPGEVGKVETVAGYLASNPSHAVVIEGHCDERGTEEYNRALGERRALSVREAMVRMGGDANRIHTLSLGEDVPAQAGQGEAVWSKNRRGEFVVLKPRQ